VPFYSNSQGIFCQPCMRSFYKEAHKRWEEKQSAALKPGYEDGRCALVKPSPEKSARKQELDMESEPASKRLKAIPGKDIV